MRSAPQATTAKHKEGMKREQKDLENRRQPKAASKQGHARSESGQGLVRRRGDKADSR